MGDPNEQNAGCDLLIVGQYLQPTKEHLEVERYVEPSHFEQKGLDKTLKYIIGKIESRNN